MLQCSPGLRTRFTKATASDAPFSSARPTGVTAKLTLYRCYVSTIQCSAAATDAAAPQSPLETGGLLPTTREVLLEGAPYSAPATIYGIPRAEWLTLQAPTRYLGSEFGAMRKPWSSATIRFALTYPEIYEVGASNLGHIILYTVLNQAAGLMCDRSYFPGPDMISLLKKHEKPLFAVESRRPLCDFDVLGFSLAYELGGTNVLEMLKLSNIPIQWKERLEGEDVPWDVSTGSPPLIFAGGPTATSNPEPFADFFDFFALGDGEELLVEIGKCLQRCREGRRSRRATLLALACEVEGVYVPQFYEPSGLGGAVYPVVEGVPERVRRRVAMPDPFQQIGLVPFVQTVHDRMTVEIRRGCTRGCRFCQPGMLTRPARDVEPEKVVAAVAEGLRKTGYDEFSLLSLSCSDYLALPAVGLQIKNELREENVSLSLPSQRVDRFNDDIANIIGGTRKGGITFAPEAGTQRMRDIINKGLTDEELMRGVKTAWDRGWRQVKLYFMIGLPGETDDDVAGIAHTVRRVQRECRSGKWHMAVHVTVSNFTPKPHTPFQWHSVSTAEFERKQALLRRLFEDMPQVKVNYTSVRVSAMEDFVGRGDRRVGAVVRGAWERGALNDAWWESEKEAFATWSAAAAAAGMDWKYRQVEEGEWDVLEALADERYRRQGGAGGRGRLDRGALADMRLDMPLPWDVVDTGIARWWLKAELQRALEASTLSDCSHSGHCSECGVCGDDMMGHNVVAPVPPTPEYLGPANPRTHVAQRLRFTFSKGGDAVFVGHLDLMRAMERACRRAALPLAFDKSPYHAHVQVLLGMPLPMGATSDCERLETLLTQRIDPRGAMQRLQAQLPPGLVLLSVEEAEVRKADGSATETLQQLLDEVEYYVLVAQVPPSPPADSPDVLPSAPARADLSAAVAGVLSMESYNVERVGRKNPRRRTREDVRALLRRAELCADVAATPLAAAAPDVLLATAAQCDSAGLAWGVVRFSTGKKADNNPMPPSRFVEMLSSAAGAPLALAHMHRGAVRLATPRPPRLREDMRQAARSLLRWEGHMAVKAQFGIGPWAPGLEHRVDDHNVRV